MEGEAFASPILFRNKPIDSKLLKTRPTEIENIANETHGALRRSYAR